MDRIGIIDIGTNTTRVIVFDLAESPPGTVFEDDRVTRLGRGIAGRRRRLRLLEESVARTLRQVAEYKKRADEAGAGRVIAVCTSAVRDAENQGEFVAELLKLGVEPRVLSGDEEAELVFRGVEMGRRATRLRGREAGDTVSSNTVAGEMVVVDVGGGSTELIAGDAIAGRAARPRGISINEGAVRLTERFVRSDPPSGEELALMENHVEHELRKALKRIAPAPGAALIGVAGTAVTLAMVAMRTPDFVPEKIHAYNISRAEVEGMYRDFAAATVSRRRDITGMEPGREDVIVAGACLFACVMRALGAETLEVSVCDLRHGLLMEVMESR